MGDTCLIKVVTVTPEMLSMVPMQPSPSNADLKWQGLQEAQVARA